MESGVQLVFNAVPIAVGIYILQNQDKNQKDSLNALEKALQINQKDSLNALEKTLQIQDKNLKDVLLIQDKNQKDSLNALEKALQIQDKNLKDILIADKNLWNERFNNFILRLNNTSQ
jgi:Mg2+/Co2+ transporter CorC